MAVAYDAASSQTLSGGQYTTWSHTVTGSNTLLVVGVAAQATASISTLTYGGAAMTRVAQVQNTGDCSTEIWVKTGAATGANTIAASGSASTNYSFGGVSFTGVNQTTAYSNVLAASADGPAISINLTGVDATGMFFYCAGAFLVATATLTANTTGGTQRWNNAPSANLVGAGGTAPGAASLTAAWSQGTAGNFSNGGLYVVAASVGPPTGSLASTGAGK